MAKKKGNTLLLVIVGIILAGIVLAIVVGKQYLSSESGADSSSFVSNFFTLNQQKEKDDEVRMDGDLPEHTLSKVTTDYANVKGKLSGYSESMTLQEEQINKMSQALDTLTEQNTELQRQLKDQGALMSALQAQRPNESESFDAASFKQEIVEQLSQVVPSLVERVGGSSNRTTLSNNTDDDSNSDGTNDSVDDPKTIKHTRVRSRTLPRNKEGEVDESFIEKLREQSKESNQNNVERDRQTSVKVDPRYTIPKNSILNDVTTISTLIGRVPVNGDVENPSKFKLVVGQDNMAANGFDIPGLDGMILAGTVTGDAVLSCVKTRITSATYIFEDGAILNFPSSDARNVTLGYIADAHGNDCIPGKLISNKKKQTILNILTGGATGAAEAFADNETTTTVDSSGNTVKNVTGDSNKYILGAAISGSTRRLTDTLNKQGFDEWSSVIVPNGKIVTVHIEEQIELDNASNLRKIVYEKEYHHSTGTD